MWVDVWEVLRLMHVEQQAPEMTPVQSVWSSWCHADKLLSLVWLWLPHRVSLPTEVYQLGHVKTTIFLKSPVLLLFIDYRQKCVEDASESSPAWSQLCDNPYGNRWQQFGLVTPNGCVLSLHYATVRTLWPFFSTGNSLKRPTKSQALPLS